jgi:uncharacterized protein DUF4245/HAAS domain-containing protein
MSMNASGRADSHAGTDAGQPGFSTIDELLAAVERQLSMAADERALILEELRGHLEEAATAREAAGQDRAAAEREAVAAFGAAGAVAARLNRAHPVHWGTARMLRGTLAGILIPYAVWTLVTFPLLVYNYAHLTTQERASQPISLWGMAFDALPLAFGAFRVLFSGAGLVWLAAFLALSLAVPFAWGRRSRQSWRPGLAYGLGLLVGFWWLLPGILIRRDDFEQAQFVLSAAAVWALAPLAVAASFAGARLHLPARLSAAFQSPRPSTRSSTTRRLPAARALTVGVAVILLGANVWAGTRAAELARAEVLPPVSEQLARAQAIAAFPLRLPSALPDRLTLTSVELVPGATARPWVALQYESADGVWLTLSETNAQPADDSLPIAPNYRVSQGTVGGAQPVWWLYTRKITARETILMWQQDGLYFTLASDGPFSVDELKQVAASV